ncbi:MAG: hypothetical protein KGI06_05505 [Candidatus Micrarchaeota archaeon]|nr:hypothetical protein [Candidatus Micrarchaeota archaeon]
MKKQKFARWGQNSSIIGLVAVIASLVTALLASFAIGSGGTVTATGYINVRNSCNFAISNTIVYFGTLDPGTNTIGTGASGVNVITITNTGGNPSNVEISGSNWNYNSNSFSVSNTAWSGIAANSLWSPSASSSKTGTANVEVQLSGSTVDTLLETQNSLTQSNSIWLGAAVPAAQIGSGASTYTQTINVISTC